MPEIDPIGNFFDEYCIHCKRIEHCKKTNNAFQNMKMCVKIMTLKALEKKVIF